MPEQRPLPHNVDAESAVLGSILIDNRAYHTVAAFLKPEHFYSQANAEIYRAMGTLLDAGEPVDTLTLELALGTPPAAATAADLLLVVPTSIHAEQYARQVYAYALRREAIRSASKIATAAYDDSLTLAELAEAAETAVTAVTGSLAHDRLVKVDVGMTRLVELVERRANSAEPLGLPTGFTDLDRLIGGLRGGDVVVVAGRPGMGKSALESAVSLHVAKAEKRVLRFSLEMSAERQLIRLTSIETGIDGRRLERGELQPAEWSLLREAGDRLGRLPMWIDETAALTPAQMRAKCQRMYAEHGLDLVTIDYLQLMGGERTNSNRTQEVGQISRAIKALARELDIPVLELAQLSRACEQRQNKRPQLSDLRESGDIENDADIVMFLYRDEYYHEDTERPGTAEVIIAKNRNGPTGTVELHWNGALTRFGNLMRQEIVL